MDQSIKKSFIGDDVLNEGTFGAILNPKHSRKEQWKEHKKTT
jgi:hypothetical protein